MKIKRTGFTLIELLDDQQLTWVSGQRMADVDAARNALQNPKIWAKYGD